MFISQVMPWSQVMQAVTTLGFPIVMCGAMSWFIKYTTDRNREDVAKINEEHRKEMNDVTEAIKNNTIALEKLCERMEKE